MKFRKKPVVIDAWQLNLADDEGVLELFNKVYSSTLKLGTNLLGDALAQTALAEVRKRNGLLIPTLEGDILASDGDWIIQGVNGEFYPCKPDIFEKTYEAVDEIF